MQKLTVILAMFVCAQIALADEIAIVTPTGTPLTTGHLIEASGPHNGTDAGIGPNNVIQSGSVAGGGLGGTFPNPSLGTFTNTYDAKAVCGIKADGVTDDSGALNSCISAIGTLNGGVIQLPRATIAVANTVDNQFPNVCIQGYGTDFPHNTGAQGVYAATTLLWTGSSGGTMVWWHTPEGNDSGTKLSGGCVRGIYFNSGKVASNTGANYGLRVTSWVYGDFSNNYFWQMQVSGMLFDLVVHLFDPRDSQHNVIENDRCYNAAASNNNEAGDCLELVGDASAPSGSHGTGTAANVSVNYVNNLYDYNQNGFAVHFYDTDHNHVYNTVSNTCCAGTGGSILFEGSNNGTGFTARKNDVTGISGGKVLVRGTTTYTYPSSNNILSNTDTGNGTSVTVETGATINCGVDTAGNTGACSQGSGLFYFPGATSGSTMLQASPVASGTLTLPATTDTLVGLSTLGTAAFLNVGTSGPTNIPQFGGANTWSGLQSLAGGMTCGGNACNLNNNSNFNSTINGGTSTGSIIIGNSSNLARTVLNGLGTGTAADVLCITAGNTVILQAAASCTISSKRFKNLHGKLTTDALSAIMKLDVWQYTMKPTKPANRDPNARMPQVGLLAEDVAKIMPQCALYENDMKTPKSARPVFGT